jgi:ribonuclease P protein component
MEMLFQKGLSFVAYPMRVIYYPIVGAGFTPAQSSSVSVLFSIPKKKIKLAVNRNYIKRRIRESYRLRKHELIRLFSEKDKKLLLAFIYMIDEKSSFKTIDKAMSKAISRLIGEAGEKGEMGKTGEKGETGEKGKARETGN